MISPAQAVMDLLDCSCPPNSGYQAPRAKVAFDDVELDTRKMVAQKVKPTPCQRGKSIGVSIAFMVESIDALRRHGPCSVKQLVTAMNPYGVYDENKESLMRKALRLHIKSNRCIRRAVKQPGMTRSVYMYEARS